MEQPRISWKKAFVYFVLHYFKEKVLPQRVSSAVYLITDCVSCLHARNYNGKAFFLPVIANILFVSINFTLEKVFVTFFVQMKVRS